MLRRPRIDCKNVIYRFRKNIANVLSCVGARSELLLYIDILKDLLTVEYTNVNTSTVE